MYDRDDLIMTTLMDIKENTGNLTGRVENLEQQLSDVAADVSTLKTDRDQVSGGWKVVVSISSIVAAIIGWFSGHLGGMR